MRTVRRVGVILSVLLVSLLGSATSHAQESDQEQEEKAAAISCYMTVGPPSYFYEYINGVRTKMVGATTSIQCSGVAEYIFVSSHLTRNYAWKAGRTRVCGLRTNCAVFVSTRHSAGTWHNWGSGYVEQPKYVRIYNFSQRRSSCVTL